MALILSYADYKMVYKAIIWWPCWYYNIFLTDMKSSVDEIASDFRIADVEQCLIIRRVSSPETVDELVHSSDSLKTSSGSGHSINVYTDDIKIWCHIDIFKILL